MMKSADYKDKSCVARVYLGNRMDVGDRKMIESRLNKLKIPTSIMKLRGYSMSFDLKRKKYT
jgi:hypothetical protein